MSQQPPPLPLNRDSHIKLALIERENSDLKSSIDKLTTAMQQSQDNMQRLSIVVENLSVKVAGISDLVIKIGVPLLISFFGALITYLLKK